jgi:hypothetical protein
MAEGDKKPRRRSRGLFSGPDDGLLGGMGPASARPRPKARQKWKPTVSPTPVSDPTQPRVAKTAQVRIGADPDATETIAMGAAEEAIEPPIEVLDETVDAAVPDDDSDLPPPDLDALGVPSHTEEDFDIGSAGLRLLMPDGPTEDGEDTADFLSSDEEGAPELPDDEDFLRVAFPDFGPATGDDVTEEPGAGTLPAPAAAPASIRVAPSPRGDSDGGLIGMVEDEPAPAPRRTVHVEAPTHQYWTGRDEVDASVFFGGEEGVFDLSHSPDDPPPEPPPETPEEELDGLGELPRAGERPVVVRDDVSHDGFSSDIRVRAPEDAGVWETKEPEAQLPSGSARPPSKPRAWWEERSDGPAPPKRAAPKPTPEPKKRWSTPDTLDLRGQTREERETKRQRRVLVTGAVVILVVLVAMLGAKSLGLFDKPPVAPPLTPAELEGPPVEVPIEVPETDPGAQDPVEEPPPVEDPPTDPVDPPPTDPVDVPPPSEGPTEATDAAEAAANEALMASGTLRVESSPRAVIYVDRKRIGQTPLDLELEPGTHSVKAVAPGRAPKTQTVKIKPAAASKISFDF